MLIDTKIQKIIGGGYEVKEIKYMGNTIWKKELENPCQTTCQNCQSTCEKSCQTDCQKSCQDACQKTSQCGRRQACYGCQGRQCGNQQGGDS